MRIFLLMLALALAPVAEAATLQVGPTRTYTLP
jgi:hypothetical protein